jgi:hypothetical protein
MKVEQHRAILTSLVSSAPAQVGALGAPFCPTPSLPLPVLRLASALHHLFSEGLVFSLPDLRTLVGSFRSRGEAYHAGDGGRISAFRCPLSR